MSETKAAQKTIVEELKKIINLTTSISEESWQLLVKISEIIELPKKSKLIEIGDKPEYFYFILSGNTRGYIITQNNTEYNKALFTKNMFFGALAALVKNSITSVAYETLSKSKLIKIDFNKFSKLVDTKKDINIFYIKMLENVFLKLEQRDIEMTTLDATQRYLNLKERLPNIDKEISLYHIASNLGITPIQLSRIRKKLLFN
ncbi:Crp/Fnr family transcriptional regulator [Bacteroidota bacterium]